MIGFCCGKQLANRERCTTPTKFSRRFFYSEAELTFQCVGFKKKCLENKINLRYLRVQHFLFLSDKTKKRRKNEDSEYVIDIEHDGMYRNETKKLRKLLKLYFYATFKLKNNTCSFHSVNIFLLLIQVIKIALVTSQVGYT